jgi:histidinol-phosphate aminotransferase
MDFPKMRADLADLPAYKAGQSAQSRSDIDVFKISSNENPYAPHPKIIEAISRAANSIQRYPDPNATRLVQKLADKYQVTPDQISLGTGSVAVLTQLIQASASVGDEVIFAWRSFEAYPIVTKVAGATAVKVPLTINHEHDLPKMLNAITDKTKTILVCSPNNPTGPIVKKQDFLNFLKEVPKDILVVLDEAYTEFVTDPAAINGTQDVITESNVAILRTFSKAYGLAGLRVGFTIAQEPVIDYLKKVALPFGVSSLAQAAAIAALEHEPELLQTVNALTLERDRVFNELTKQGWNLAQPQGNFIWFDLKEKSQEFAQACEAAGIIVRLFINEGVRATIAETVANNRLIEVASQFRL